MIKCDVKPKRKYRKSDRRPVEILFKEEDGQWIVQADNIPDTICHFDNEKDALMFAEESRKIMEFNISLTRKIRLIREEMIKQIAKIENVKESVLEEVLYQDEVLSDFKKVLMETDIRELLQCRSAIQVASKTRKYKGLTA